jgi:predicted transcriptional regulator
MQTPKEATQQLLDVLPDDVSMDTIMAELYVKAKVLRGLDQAARGEFVSQEEAKKRLAKWLV